VKKHFKPFVSVFVSLSLLFGATAPNLSFADHASPQDITVAWNEQTGSVEYNVTGNSLVKLRVGSAQGPVYRTLVNCEHKPAGINREKWILVDPADGVDFGPGKNLLFVIETDDRLQKDRTLKVQSKE
jgi:hypothetical protein